MEEELAAGELAESVEGPKNLSDSAEGYIPVQWTRKKIALAVAVGVVVAALFLGCAAALYLHTLDLALTGGMDAAQQDDLAKALQPPKPKAAAPDAPAKEVDEPASSAYYVAILGCDARPNETIARSDVTMLARVDTETGAVHLVSVPRDMMVEIEGHGTQKINAALAFGGPAGAVRALSAFAGVPITHYVELRFEQLVELVDRLGGVTVDVPEGFTSDTSGITLAAGTQTLNGEEALAFARERHAVSSGDFSRAAAKANSLYELRQGRLPAQPDSDSEATPKDREYISVKADYKVSLVRIADIVYIESEGEYVRMHLCDGSTITTLFRLKNMEAALPSEQFMRVHRSYIVNLRVIRSYVRGRIFLSDTEYVPIGENYKEAFQNYIDRHFKNL